jgi:zinc protease
MHSKLKFAFVATSMLAMAALPSLSFAAEPLKRDGVWAQDYAGRPADPAVRFGRLANGMRFAILKNATPAKQVSLRLRIGSGSLSERDNQQGLAHFLEHMAFKGSKHVPAGDMVQILQRKGLSFGADTNAETDQEQTVYKFNLPQNDEDSLDTGLMLLREIASELTLSQAAMDPERGVVLSEERFRDSPAFRSFVSQLGFQLQGQLAPRRIPIGKTAVLQNAPVSLIRQYYENEYRPDNATVIAIGDFDIDKMEAKIRARFSDWTPKGAELKRPDFGHVVKRGPDASVFTEAGAPQSLSLTWASPYDAAADTVSRERRDTLELLALAVLNRRLERLAQASDAPFVGAGAARDNTVKSANLTQIGVLPKAGGWQPALNAVIAEQRRLVEFGVRPDELAREIAQLRTGFVNSAEGAATRQTAKLADDLVHEVDEDDVFTSPGQDLAEFDAEVRGLTAAQVSAVTKTLFSGSGPLVFVSSPNAITGGGDAVKVALASAEAQPITQGVMEAAKTWPYANFGPPGKVVSRKEIADLGITDVTFANGVRLLIKPTTFAKDDVQVAVRVGEGRLGVPASLTRSLWTVSPFAPVFMLGGTKELTFEEIQQLLTSKVASVQLSLDDNTYLLTGVTRPQDMDTELQLLTAYTVRPGFRSQAFDRLKGALTTQIPQLDASALGVFQRDAGVLLHGGDRRWALLPTSDILASSTPEDVPALLAGALAEGAIEVNVVGDITADHAIDAVAKAYGALAPRHLGDAAPSQASGVAFPSPAAQPVVETHKGRADQAFALVAWPTRDFYANVREQRVLGVLSEVLKNRLTDRLRVALGATYSPVADTDSSEVFKGYGYLDAYVETPVDKLDSFYSEVEKIIAELRDQPPSQDELARAKSPRIEQRIKLQQTNLYWLSALSRAAADARELDAVRSAVTDVQGVTGEDVRTAAQRYLKEGQEFRFVVRAKVNDAGMLPLSSEVQLPPGSH